MAITVPYQEIHFGDETRLLLGWRERTLPSPACWTLLLPRKEQSRVQVFQGRT